LLSVETRGQQRFTRLQPFTTKSTYTAVALVKNVKKHQKDLLSNLEKRFNQHAKNSRPQKQTKINILNCLKLHVHVIKGVKK